MIDSSQHNNRILQRLPELLDYFKYAHLYNSLILIFSDISHYNKNVQKILQNGKIFDKLDFDQEITKELIFAMCDKNEELLKEYKDAYFQKDYLNSQKINRLMNDIN